MATLKTHGPWFQLTGPWWAGSCPTLGLRCTAVAIIEPRRLEKQLLVVDFLILMWKTRILAQLEGNKTDGTEKGWRKRTVGSMGLCLDPGLCLRLFAGYLQEQSYILKIQ